MTHFILADNQELTAYALQSLLHDMGEEPARLITDKAGLIDRLKEQPDSIILLDYTLFDFNDEENLIIVNERFPQAKWILASDDLTETALRRFVYECHNISIVFKDCTLKTFRDAIEFALRGERFICQKATEMLLFQQQEEETTPRILTQTEIEILTLIAQGKTTKDIAQERFSSVHTINTHRKNIFRKLHVNTAHEAVKYAFRAGLVDPSEFYI